MLLTATKTVDVIRFCLYWAYVAIMVLLLTDGLHVVDADEAIWSSHALRRWLLGALIAAEALTLVTWYLIHHVMPAAVLALVSRADLRLWC